MNQTKIAALLLSLGMTTVACNQDEETSDLSWGHLSDLKAKSPFFLINKKPGDVYKVCMARYLVDDLPGIQEEIKAAVQVWGTYIGRNIPIKIVLNSQMKRQSLAEYKEVKKANPTTNPANQLRTQYYKDCDPMGTEKFDLVVGYIPFEDSTVGQTGYYWKGYSADQVTSFQRHLFLRDYKVAPDMWGTKRWMTLQQINLKTTLSQELLTTMLDRKTTKHAQQGTAVTLPVLVHEVGHIWGLCDQYSGPTNCDPNLEFRTPHPDTSSIMAAATNVAKIYLTDDDITGIRKMATRDGFDDYWPGTEDAINSTAAAL